MTDTPSQKGIPQTDRTEVQLQLCGVRGEFSRYLSQFASLLTALTTDDCDVNVVNSTDSDTDEEEDVEDEKEGDDLEDEEQERQ